MSGKAAVTVALQPNGTAAATASEKSCPFVLKKIMDIPPPNILEEGDDGKTKTLWVSYTERISCDFCRIIWECAVK